jgi:RND family efflux transporter MFP subunit
LGISMDDPSTQAGILRRALGPVVIGVLLLAGVAFAPGLARVKPSVEPPVPVVEEEAPAWTVDTVDRDFEALSSIGEARPTLVGVSEHAADAPLDCLIEPSRTVNLGSEIVGLIDRIEVERGDLISEGQVLVRLESSVKQASVEIARARAGMDAAILARATSQKLGLEKMIRARKLYNEKTMSLDVRQEIEAEARLADLHLQEAYDSKHLARLELERAERDLSRRTITSPVSGVVVERIMSEGEVVDDDKVILRIARIDPLRVEAILPAARFGKIEKGQKATVIPEIPGDKLHVASVALVERVIDPASGTFGVSLDLPNPDLSIPSGLNCEVRFMEQ